MTKRIVTVGFEDTLSTVKEIFDTVKFHHLLVVEDGELQGIVSDRDLLQGHAQIQRIVLGDSANAKRTGRDRGVRVGRRAGVGEGRAEERVKNSSPHFVKMGRWRRAARRASRRRRGALPTSKQPSRP